jgi:hypothetical protein
MLKETDVFSALRAFPIPTAECPSQSIGVFQTNKQTNLAQQRSGLLLERYLELGGKPFYDDVRLLKARPAFIFYALCGALIQEL